MDDIFIRKKEREIQTRRHRGDIHREEGHVKTEAEIEVMQLQAKEEAKKRQGKILPVSLQRERALLTP